MDTGPLDEAIGPAEQAGLVERSGTGRLLLHPAVVQAGRTLDPELYRNAVRAMYVIWDHYYRQAQEAAGPASQRVLAQCTAAEVPYLMRLGEWEQASRACERAINHDGSPAMAGRLLPYDVQIVRAAEGTDLYPGALFVYTNLVRTLDEERGQAALTRLLKQAEHDKDDTMVMVAASALATVLAGRDPARAYELLQRAKAARAAAEHQAWPWASGCRNATPLTPRRRRSVLRRWPRALLQGMVAWPGAKGVSQGDPAGLPPGTASLWGGAATWWPGDGSIACGTGRPISSPVQEVTHAGNPRLRHLGGVDGQPRYRHERIPRL